MTQEKTQTFYEREIANCDLTELVKRAEANEKEQNLAKVLKPDLLKIDSGFDFLSSGQNQVISEFMHPDILENFLDHLRSDCSFIKARVYLRNLHDFLKNNQDYYETIAEPCKMLFLSASTPLTNLAEHYVGRLYQKPKNRNFELGDKVRTIKTNKRLGPHWEYIRRRNECFDIGSIGTIVDFYANFPKVYFQKKPKNKFNEDIRSLGEYSIEWIKQHDAKRNIAVYDIKELKFLPPNRVQINTFYDEIKSLEDYLKKCKSK